ncbi:MAG: hypothetical protein AB7P04_13515 [Bacteriovoracia bacterium]
MSNHGGPCVMTNTDQFYVRACGCGVVHLSFGPSVINVSQEAFVAVAETMAELSQEIRKRIQAPEQATVDSAGNVIYGRFPKTEQK